MAERVLGTRRTARPADPAELITSTTAFPINGAVDADTLGALQPPA